MSYRILSGLAAVFISTVPAAVASAQTKAPVAAHLNRFASIEKKIVSLAEAMPDDKYDWRPAPNVRSVGEAYLHAAGTLYFLGKMLGTPPPIDPKSLRSIKGKKATVDALKKALAHAKTVMKNVPKATFDKKIDLFGQPATGQEVVLLMLVHTSEHLGQGIAYARSNGIAPPWSKKK